MRVNKVNTLRVAITDRCNLRCIYCMPAEGIAVKPQKDILTFEEITRVVRIAVNHGVQKVRLTGGEPLIRRNIEQLIKMLAPIPGLKDFAMTTNGIFLADKAQTLKQAGLKRVTISLDTLNPEQYTKITRKGNLNQVMAGIKAAQKAGLTPLKINVVAMRDVNHEEALDFVDFAAEKDLEVRFIELMPIDANGGNFCSNRKGSAFIAYDKIKKLIEAGRGPLEPADSLPGSPAQRFNLPGGKGRIGFISAVSEPFCQGCTRMRLTADGKLRGCLLSSSEIDVLSPLRNSPDDEAVIKAYQKALLLKPKRLSPLFSDNQRWMSQIGG